MGEAEKVVNGSKRPTALATVASRTRSGQLDTACCPCPWPLDLNAVTFQRERLSQGPLLIPKLLSWLLWLLGALVSTAPSSPPLQGQLSIQEKIISGLITSQQSHPHPVDRPGNPLPANLNCVSEPCFAAVDQS